MEQGPLIVGAGPTGLSAALFLAEGGVQSRVIDKAPAPSINSRAQVINPRSLELLRQTGVTDAILHEARPIHRVIFYEDWRPLTELEFGHAHPDYQMAVLPQARTEALLAEALAVTQNNNRKPFGPGKSWRKVGKASSRFLRTLVRTKKPPRPSTRSLSK
jgi:2-polyprenyl-6-methoxyphenol hydroxylase-like FAD-dependent oxidoreductase